ncbi:MAG: carboxypeptidase regulatory-like domain-containing protein [Acidobacteria bacterium]|nr:carboxypeptidase regulatory-like domain-containing protein [Acidobacteriota bacterium]
MKVGLRSFLGLAACVLCLAQVAFGQRAGVQGVVTDSSGGVMVGAVVKVSNLDTGVTNRALTNEVGFYAFPLLEQGRFKVECTAKGFAPQEQPELRLEVGQTARLDFRLHPGAMAEVIRVSGSATLLQSETTEVGQLIDGKRILEMPLNRRNYLELAQFTVGVLPARQLGKGVRQDGASGGEGAFRAGGTQVGQNAVLLDGTDNSSRLGGGVLGFQMQAVKPPVDAVSEFKVITNNTSAEYGYRTGAKVLVSTKSGTNELHGSVYEFLRNDKLDGSNFFANRVGSKKPAFRQNQFGGTAGGPILKNRTFFFFSFQGTRIRLGQSYTSSVPSRDVLNGDFSQQPPTRRNIFDPLTLTGTGAAAQRMPFPGNRIPSTRFDAVAKRVADLYPSPSISGREHLPNNFFLSPSDSDDADQYDLRFDHNITDSHRMFIRYSIRNQLTDQPGPLPYPATGGIGQIVVLDADNVTMTLNSTFGSNKNNELRFGFTHFPTRFDIPSAFQENLNPKLGIKGAPGDTFGDGLEYGMTLFQPSDFQSLGPQGFFPNRLLGGICG